MKPDTSNLSDLVSELESELRSLLGPAIHFATGRLAAEGTPIVRVLRDELVDLLRHLALDARDAMPDGGVVTIRTGCLREATECAAIVLHELPDASTGDELESRIHKGRSLGLAAAHEIIERASGHFHVSCRGRETVLTICFPLAQ